MIKEIYTVYLYGSTKAKNKAEKAIVEYFSKKQYFFIDTSKLKTFLDEVQDVVIKINKENNSKISFSLRIDHDDYKDIRFTKEISLFLTKYYFYDVDQYVTAPTLDF